MNRFEERLNKLKAKFAKAGINGLYITQTANVSYFTGHAGNDCILFVTADKTYILSDFRYLEMVQSITWMEYVDVLKTEPSDFLASCGEKRIGVETDYLPLGQYLNFRKKMPSKEFVPVKGLVEELRMIKDEYEIESTRKAAVIGNKTFTHMCEFIKPGMTEKEISAELGHYMMVCGAEGLSFSTIVASGPNGSKPHAVPSERRVQKGDFITMDYGCLYEGYCSDMTRTVALGEPTQEMRDVYNIVLEAQTACCSYVKAGITGIEGDKIARDVIEKAGYGEYFGHGTGHGTGLEIHELPRLAPKYAGVIPENATTSVEPGIYLPGKFGVRIEDLAIVKANGIINLVDAPKELTVL